MEETHHFSVPVEEKQPLMEDHDQDEQPQKHCLRRADFCRRRHSVDGQHGKSSRRRIFTRHVLATMILVYAFYYIFQSSGPHNLRYEYGDDDTNAPEALDYLQVGRERCRDNLIPWDGPSHFETRATNIELKIGKGDLATNVSVLTNHKIDHPTVEIHANVSYNRHHDHDHDHDDENDDEEVDAYTKKIHHQGLHVHVHEKHDKFEITLWADKDKGHCRHHHRRHHHRFCGNIDVVITLPKSLHDFGHLAIHGPVMNVHTKDIAAIDFKSVNIHSAVGEIKVHGDGVTTKKLKAFVSAGTVSVSSLTAPAGTAVKALVRAAVGPVSVNAVIPQEPIRHGKHHLTVRSSTGTVDLNVRPGKADKSMMKGVPGRLHVEASSKLGQVRTSVEVAEKQVLHLKSKSSTGSVDSTVSDNFLGRLKLITAFGSTKVIEAADSPSEIKYDQNTSRRKCGRKHLKKDVDDDDVEGEEEVEKRLRADDDDDDVYDDDDDDEDGDEDENGGGGDDDDDDGDYEGRIFLGTVFGRAELAFA
ncbi:hypothetical protein BGZ51_002966 [Haplosporangium sp. Z 767]|nr:hypothetical protein BGZ51_002966 [Haplosporangium sp. Z 767]KAF9196879.1 hypothetical protein BGZ50_005954 [Haplosporangium sp. Z 11]